MKMNSIITLLIVSLAIVFLVDIGEMATQPINLPLIPVNVTKDDCARIQQSQQQNKLNICTDDLNAQCVQYCASTFKPPVSQISHIFYY